MNAIDLLKQQHQEANELFEELEGLGEHAIKSKERAFQKVADHIAVHSEIEERLFYPEAKEAAPETEDLLRESVEEHLAVKRVLADLLETSPEDAQFDARCKVLGEQFRAHVEEEETELFPMVEKACSAEALEDLGQRMEQLADDLESKGQPSSEIPGQTDAPSQI